MARLRPNSVSTGSDGDAVRLHAAIAAALADQLVDDDALVRVGKRAALAAPALFGGAGLVVDQHRDAADLAQARFCTRRAPRGGGWWCRPASACRRIFLRLVGDDHDALRAFGRDLARDLRHGHAAVDLLAAGHRDRVVEEKLVGDVDAGGDRGADREAAGMVVGAVAEILEDVRRASRTAPRRPSSRPRRPSGCSPRSSGPSTAPCSGSRCRHRRASLRARRSTNCAGSPSRNRECGPRCPGFPPARAARPCSRATRDFEVLVGDVLQHPVADADRDVVADRARP